MTNTNEQQQPSLIEELITPLVPEKVEESLEERLDRTDEELKRIVLKLNKYIQSNGSSKDLKKKSQKYTKKICK